MPKSREEVVESFGNRVKGFISYAWSDGYLASQEIRYTIRYKGEGSDKE